MTTTSGKTTSRILFCVFATATLSTTLRAQDSKPAKGADLRPLLLGAWVLTGPPGNRRVPPPDAEMKFWGLGDFAVTKRNAATGKIDYHHVGTYTLDGDQYSETVTFATGGNEGLTGKTFKFRIQVNGDTYIQHGLGNPWTQQWKRLGVATAERDDPAR